MSRAWVCRCGSGRSRSVGLSVTALAECARREAVDVRGLTQPGDSWHPATPIRTDYLRFPAEKPLPMGMIRLILANDPVRRPRADCWLGPIPSSRPSFQPNCRSLRAALDTTELPSLQVLRIAGTAKGFPTLRQPSRGKGAQRGPFFPGVEARTDLDLGYRYEARSGSPPDVVRPVVTTQLGQGGVQQSPPPRRETEQKRFLAGALHSRPLSRTRPGSRSGCSRLRCARIRSAGRDLSSTLAWNWDLQERALQQMVHEMMREMAHPSLLDACGQSRYPSSCNPNA